MMLAGSDALVSSLLATWRRFCQYAGSRILMILIAHDGLVAILNFTAR